MINNMRVTREPGNLYTLYINGKTYTELMIEEVYEIINVEDKDVSEVPKVTKTTD